MALAIDFAASLSGTTLTVTLSVGSGYPNPVDSFQIDTLLFDSTVGTYVGTVGAPGFSVITNVNSASSLTIGGFSSNGTTTIGAGGLLATLTFTVAPGTTSFTISRADGSLNADNPATETPGALTVPCFAAGTLIRTPRGDVAVEALAIGDEVCTLLRAATARVIWVGHRSMDCRGHARPHDVQPVRIAAGAVADGVPQRDLVLSPDHSIYLDGVLIPVRYLLNGATIVQLEVARIIYFHIELDRHNLLLAEGLAAETYLDTGNRAAFVEADVVRLSDADFARGVWATASCAELVAGGPRLEAVRQRLLQRALQLGHELAADPQLRLVADGRMLDAEIDGAVWRVRLPANTRELHVQSRAVVPAQRSAAAADHRRLGVAVAALAVDGASVGLDDARLVRGWHAPEGGWRWTDGAAALDVAGAGMVEMTIAITEIYWTQPGEALQAVA
jgi:hypothetical protein